MPSKGGFQLTENDIDILTWVYQCRLVTIDHVCLLTGRSRRRINTRLLGLVKHGYLYRKRFMLAEHLPLTHQKYVYTIHQKAVPFLVERGVASREIIDFRVRAAELKPLFIKHSLLVTDIHVALSLASRVSPIKLVDWRGEGKDLSDTVTVIEAGERKKYPVRPDAFFTLQDTRRPEGRNLADFFLEADRSTTTNKRFQRKIKGYHAYFEQGLHTKKYGIKSARVITITQTEARAVNLCEASREVLPTSDAKFYYFASVKYFAFEDSERVFGYIFMSSRDFDTDVRYGFVPPLAK